jgi:hypothetical protein
MAAGFASGYAVPRRAEIRTSEPQNHGSQRSRVKKNTEDRGQKEYPILDSGYWILESGCWMLEKSAEYR